MIVFQLIATIALLWSAIKVAEYFLPTGMFVVCFIELFLLCTLIGVWK